MPSLRSGRDLDEASCGHTGRRIPDIGWVSAYSVLNTSDDFPDPDTPVDTTSVSRGMIVELSDGRAGLAASFWPLAVYARKTSKVNYLPSTSKICRLSMEITPCIAFP